MNAFQSRTANDYDINHFSWFVTVTIWNIFFVRGKEQKNTAMKNYEWKLKFPHFLTEEQLLQSA